MIMKRADDGTVTSGPHREDDVSGGKRDALYSKSCDGVVHELSMSCHETITSQSESDNAIGS